MRRKAEKKIRAAAASLGTANRYRIDQIRARTDLIRKVFDKTILDMARLNTIELQDGDVENLSQAEISELIHHLGRRYVYFTFIDGTLGRMPEKVTEAEKINPKLIGVEKEMWLKFEYLCNTREGKHPTQKLCEMIKAYINNAD
jgi:hypothetical protein